jgi:hydrogenase maturation protease
MASPEVRTVVIGIGNPLMRDDDLGLVALERLRTGYQLPQVELHDGGTWGMNLLPTIEAADRLLVLDAIDQESTPGTVIELVGAAVPRYLGLKLSPHQTDLADVLALAQLRGTLPPDLVAIGAQPDRVEVGLGLTPAVEGAVEAVVGRAIQRLRAWGLEVRAPEPAGRA